MSSMLNVIFDAMKFDFGNAWVVSGLLAIVLIVLFFLMTQDFFAAIVLTLMPYSIMAIANFEGTESLIPYMIIILSLILALMMGRIFSR